LYVKDVSTPNNRLYPRKIKNIVQLGVSSKITKLAGRPEKLIQKLRLYNV